MILSFLVILGVGLILLFSAPFIGFLTPSNHIFLVDMSNSTPVLLSSGADTLWYQWQSWIYIGIFCLLLIILCSCVFNFLRAFTDKAIHKYQKVLHEKAEELENLKKEYRQKVEKEVQQALKDEDDRLNQKELKLLTVQSTLDRQKKNNQKLAVETKNKIKVQQKETQSKLSQRDRLSEQKKLIAQFLEKRNWTLENGEKVTYNKLLKLAKSGK